MDRFGFSRESYETNKSDGKIENSQENDTSIPLHTFQSVTTLLFRKSFRDYCAKFYSFLKQKNSLINSRINRLEVDHDGRLSMINLIDAVSQLNEMQWEFARLFSRFIDANKLEELQKIESESLEILLSVWKFLEATNLHKIESVVYGQKSLLQKMKHNIEEFFTKDLATFEGVNAVSNIVIQASGKKTLYVSVELEKTDNFMKALYKGFKNRFPKNGMFTIESLHTLNFISQIVVCPVIGEFYSLGAIDIKVRNLTNFDEEKFTKYVLPYEPDSYMKDHFTFPTEGNSVYHWNMLYALSNALKLVMLHADRVIQSLSSMPPNTMIEDTVFYSWCDNGVSEVSKLTRQMFVDLQALSGVIRRIPETNENLKILEESIRTIEDNKEIFIKSPDKSQFLSLVENLEIIIGNFFPYISKNYADKV